MIIVLHPWAAVAAAISTIVGGIEVVEVQTIDEAKKQVQSAHLVVVEPMYYLEAVRELSPLIPVVVLTSSMDGGILEQALSDGAHGYIHVSEPLRAWAMTISDVFYGIPSRIEVDKARSAMDAMRKTAQAQLGIATLLTERELEALRLITTGAGYQEIAEKMHVTRSRVSALCVSIFEKLGAKNRVDAAVIAVKAGLEEVDDG